MKKLILTFFLAIICTYIYAEEPPDIIVRVSPISTTYRNIKSNGKSLFELSIFYNEGIALHNLELSVLNNDNLEITLDRTKINSLEPRETVRINMEITNNYKYYFDKNANITIRISNDEFTQNFNHAYTIKPVENFWLFIVLSIAFAITILFVIIFIKMNRGEENVR